MILDLQKLNLIFLGYRIQQQEINESHKYLSIATNRPELIKQYFENPPSVPFPFEEFYFIPFIIFWIKTKIQRALLIYSNSIS